MCTIIVKIMVELLSAIAVVTKQIKQSRPRKCVPISESLSEHDAVKLVKKIMGEKEVESVLQRLDRLTLDESRTTAMQTLDVVHGLVQNLRVVMDGEATLSSLMLLYALT